MNEKERLAWRALRYRIRRQGMLELDLWLGQLDREEVYADAEAREALARLLAAELPVLLAMMRGEQPVPPPLDRWLQQAGQEGSDRE